MIKKYFLLKRHKKVKKLINEAILENSMEALNKLPYVSELRISYRDAFKTFIEFNLTDKTNLGVITTFFMDEGIHRMAKDYRTWYISNKFKKKI